MAVPAIPVGDTDAASTSVGVRWRLFIFTATSLVEVDREEPREVANLVDRCPGVVDVFLLRRAIEVRERLAVVRPGKRPRNRLVRVGEAPCERFGESGHGTEAGRAQRVRTSIDVGPRVLVENPRERVERTALCFSEQLKCGRKRRP